MNHKIDVPPFSANESAFFGDYSSISAYGGRVVPAFMHFVRWWESGDIGGAVSI